MQKRNQFRQLLDNTHQGFKLNNLQKSMVAITVASSLVMTAIPATASTASSTTGTPTGNNVYTSGGINTTTKPTSSSMTGLNPTDGSFNAVTNNTTGKTSVPATGTTPANPYPPLDPNSKTIPNAADYETDTPTDQETKEELQACAAQMNDEIQKNQKEVIEFHTANVSVIDAPFNVDTPMGEASNDANSGCFTAGKEVINLATLIPQVQTSWRGQIGNILKQQLIKRAQLLKDNIINRGCKIANESVLKALEPLQDYMKTADKMSAVVNNPEDFLGTYLASQIDIQFDQTDLAFNQTLDGIKSRVDADIAQATSKVGNGKTALNSVLANDPQAQAALDAAVAAQSQQEAAAIQAAKDAAAAQAAAAQAAVNQSMATQPAIINTPTIGSSATPAISSNATTTNSGGAQSNITITQSSPSNLYGNSMPPANTTANKNMYQP